MNKRIYLIYLNPNSKFENAKLALDLSLQYYISHIEKDENFEKRLSDRMSDAIKIGYEKVLIVGDNELKNNAVTIKNLKSGEQNFVKLKDIYEFL